MPRATSSFSRGVIISNKVDNKSINQCQQQLEQIYRQQGVQKSCSYDTILQIYKSWDSKKDIKISYKNCGRPIEVSPKEEKKITQSFKKTPNQQMRQAAKDKTINPLKISHTTIQKVVHKNNLNAFKIPTIQMITDVQKRQRVEFCQKVKYWTAKWKTVIFSDEIMIEKGIVGNKFVWKESLSDIKNSECFEKQKYPKNRLHLWGKISYEGGLSLQKVEGKLNQKLYCDIIQTFIDEQDEDLFEGKIFQQDQASCHTYKKTIEFLKDNDLEILEQPLKGAEISPIERIWAILKEEFNKLEDSLTNQQAFKKLQFEFLNNAKIKQAVKRLYSSLQQKLKTLFITKETKLIFDHLIDINIIRFQFIFIQFLLEILILVKIFDIQN